VANWRGFLDLQKFKMKNAVHVKIGYEEAVSAKRNVLGSEISSLQMLKSLRGYTRLRKQESVLKLRLKTQLKEIAGKINVLEGELPALSEGEEKLAIKSMKTSHEKETIKERQAKTGIEQEIIDIKRQLETLS